VRQARALGVRVIDRCNLTILSEPGQEDLAAFLAEQGVEVTASLPCYSPANVDRQRGDGVFERSIAGLRQLNALGYGDPARHPQDGLVLNLVYNPQGAVLPPPQGPLEADYKRELLLHFGIRFDHLFALTNMPIQRFGSTLVSKGTFGSYMQLLRDSYRPENLETVMCRSLLSVDWQGFLYDCDFNQMLGLRASVSGRSQPHLRDLLKHDPGHGHPHCRPLLRLHRRPGQQLRRGAGDRCTRCRGRGGDSHGRGCALMARPSKPLLWASAAAVALVALWAWQHFGLGALLTLDNLKASRDALQAQVLSAPVATAAVFFAVYVAAAALSIPGALILTLAAGAMFGLGWGLLLVSFASSLGALLAFLAARYLLRDAIQARFGKALAPINDGVKKDGTFYLLTLRLVPVFPFWLINLLMGLTPMGAGLLRRQPARHAGRHGGVRERGHAAGGHPVARGHPLAGLLGSFVLLGLFPLLAKAGVAWLRRRKVYAKWTKPRAFDRNLVVIGAGAGGLVSAYIAAAVKAKVTLIEGHKMGGDCLNFGCVPSKALIRSAKMVRQLKKASELGVADAAGRVDFAAVMKRVHDVIADIEPHDSVERYTGLGVEVLQGHARITSPWSVEVTLADGRQQTLTTKNIVIAAGRQPLRAADPGAEGSRLPDQRHRVGPDRVAPAPGGAGRRPDRQRAGAELRAPGQRRHAGGDGAAHHGARGPGGVGTGGRLAARRWRERAHRPPGGARRGGGGEKRLIAKAGGAEVVIPFDAAVRRGPQARVTGYGLEELGIPLTPRKTIETNAYLQTLYPNIYAVGDVAGPFQFTHTAAHQAWYAAVNALFGRFRRFKADYSRDPLGHLHRPRGGACGPERERGQGAGRGLEVTTLRHRRPRPRDCRRHRARLRQGAHRAGQGQDPGRDHRRRACRRPAGRIRAGHEAWPGAEQDPRHHPHLPDAGRSQQVRRRRMEAGACAAEAAAVGGPLPRLGANMTNLNRRKLLGLTLAAAAAALASPAHAQSPGFDHHHAAWTALLAQACAARSRRPGHAGGLRRASRLTERR
jgi:radical SAM/Cys-rich protein